MLSNHHSQIVEREVAGMLEQSPSYHALSVEDRRNILANTTRVARQLVEQQVTAPPRRGRRDPYAVGQDAPGDSPPLPGAPFAPPGAASSGNGPGPGNDRWRPDERFRAEGIAAGVTQAGRLLKEVESGVGLLDERPAARQNVAFAVRMRPSGS